MECKDQDNVIKKKLEEVDGRWAIHAALSSMKLHKLTLENEKDVRMPKILCQSDFVLNLKSRLALAALERIAFLARINRIVETAAHTILSGTSS